MKEFLKKLEEEKIVIRAPSREAWTAVFKRLDSLGYKWRGGDKLNYENSGMWTNYQKGACIELDIKSERSNQKKKEVVVTGNYGTFKRLGYKFLPYDDFIKKVGKPKPKPMLQKLTDVLKTYLDSNIQKQYKAGFRSEDVELTDEGKKALMNILANRYEEELTEKAEEIIKEAEK